VSKIAAMGGEGERRTLYICLLMSLKRGGGGARSAVKTH
jgi:hypothetical protein